MFGWDVIRVRFWFGRDEGGMVVRQDLPMEVLMGVATSALFFSQKDRGFRV